MKIEDTKKTSPNIESSWGKILKIEFETEYFYQMKKKLVKEYKQHTVFPKGSEIFKAYNLTPFNQVKVVIIGQDPYHGHGQAHGLSFSVKKGVAIPPSLKNIFKELKRDINIKEPLHGNLENWAKQGVLLLNASLTVRKGSPNSHQKIGWQYFTDATIRSISENRKNIIFLLWGNFAQQKAKIIDPNKHYILKTTHPSPFSANYGFLGCSHFSKTNALLKKLGENTIDWNTK